MESPPVASEGVWEQLRDQASGNVFFANRLLNLTRWDRPPGVQFVPLPQSIPAPPFERHQQRQQQPAADPESEAAPGPAAITIRHLVRHLVKDPGGQWVQAANPTDPAQQEQLATDTITTLAMHFLAVSPEEIRQSCVTVQCLLSLGANLLQGVNWYPPLPSPAPQSFGCMAPEPFTATLHSPATTLTLSPGRLLCGPLQPQLYPAITPQQLSTALSFQAASGELGPD